MKKIILSICSITTTIAVILIFNINLGTNQNNFSLLSLANLEALAISETEKIECDAGGIGATHCSVSQTYPGGMGSSKEVTCGTGYYACCNKDIWGNLFASCIPY